MLRGGDDPRKGRGNFGGKHARQAGHLYELVYAAACRRRGHA